MGEEATIVNSIIIWNAIIHLLNRGLVLFQFPTDFETMNISSTHRFAYKVGFLYDCLSILYPDISKTSKYEIISVHYHFFFTYRRFKDKLDEYNNSKKKYLEPFIFAHGQRHHSIQSNLYKIGCG